TPLTTQQCGADPQRGRPREVCSGMEAAAAASCYGRHLPGTPLPTGH
ncbi:PKLR isoform 3, partial [Pan troglodytes]